MQLCSGFEISANLRWVPHGSLSGSYIDLMWGRSGPSMDPYKDLIWMPMSGSSGPARLGGHGKLCYRIGRECVLHETTNISLEICINVYKMSIFHWKYV